MKKSKKIIFLIGCTFFVLSSCQRNDEKSPQNWIPESLPAIETEENQSAEGVDVPQVENEKEACEVANKVCVMGNSLTLGFGTHGMASSTAETDYYFLLQSYIQTKNEQVQMKRFPGYGWEQGTSSEERVRFLQDEIQLELEEDCDLFIIQLGDNVNTDEKLATFPEDCKQLLAWLRERNPNMRILWVFGRYNLNNAEAIQKACLEYDVEYVDISVVGMDESYKAKIGDSYEREDGTMGTIIDAGVASHPNDLGMQVIADIIVENLQYE